MFTVLHSTTLSASIRFAVCYSKVAGNLNASWHDTGVRLTVTKLHSISYGSPTREMTSYFKSTNVLPQGTFDLVYSGLLSTGRWVSLVEQTYNNGDPCVLGSNAAASSDKFHSGPQRAYLSTKSVRVRQNILLDATVTFALCYAELDGTTIDYTWRDSYIRVKISKLASIVTESITHTTTGHIASDNQAALIYTGKMLEQKWISLVDETTAEATIPQERATGPFPCASGTNAAHDPIYGSAGYDRTGPLNAALSSKTVEVNTWHLNQTITFAVCYTEDNATASAMWADSGIRLTVSKINRLYFDGSTAPPAHTADYPVRILDLHLIPTSKSPQSPSVVFN
jgi:hypothetical protein